MENVTIYQDEDSIVLYGGELCQFEICKNDWENELIPICMHLITFDDLLSIALELKRHIDCDYFDNLNDLLFAKVKNEIVNDDSEFDDMQFDSYAEEIWYHYLNDTLMPIYESLIISTCKVFYYDDLTDDERESIKGDDVPDSVYKALAEKYYDSTHVRNFAK